MHLKDIQSTSEKSEVIYKIPCKNCEQVCIGESGRKFGIRVSEHKKTVNTMQNQNTRGQHVNDQKQLLTSILPKNHADGDK